MKKIAPILLTVLLAACQSDKKADKKIPVRHQGDLPAVASIDFPELSKEAREAVFEWKNFQEFENNMTFLNQGTLKDLADHTGRMAQLADTLLMYPPPHLQTNPLEARVRVLKTRMSLLDESVSLRGLPPETIKKNLDETNLAFKNLLVQLNEKYEKEAIDALTRTQRELEAE